MKLWGKKQIYSLFLGVLACALLFALGNEPIMSANGVVGEHGQLQVIGNQLCDSAGNPVALHGMSLYWSNWDDGYYNADAVKWLRDDWKCTVVRAAMGIEPTGAYLGNPASQTQKVTAVVDAAINLGLYVIIDWHDHHADQHTRQAKEFFTAMAQKYGKYPNVIYELYNEPQNAGWPTIKTYAEEVIDAIRQYDPDNIIVVGTPNWSQYVDEAAANPIRKSNIMYTLHFYAATHKQWLRDRAMKALNQGIALFVTEWGTCEATGDGKLDNTESDIWINFMRDHNLSWCNWSLMDISETSAALNPGASKNGGWPGNMLKPSGVYVREKLIGFANTPTPTATTTPRPSNTPVKPTSTATLTPVPTSTAVTGCSIAYEVQNNWENGATIGITIQNNGSTAIAGWTLAWTFPGNQKITNLWNAGYTQNGTSVTVKDTGYNATIAAGGGKVKFGFSITYSGTNARPDAFTINGIPCSIQ